MATKIPWTQATWNWVTGCTKVGEACRHCYAERLSHRLASMKHTREKYRGVTSDWEWTGLVRCHDDVLATVPRERLIFVNSMSDTFHGAVPAITIRTALNIASTHPEKMFLFLTKRPKRAADLDLDWPDNCAVGGSIWDQPSADAMIPEILRVKSRMHFVSIEPMLGPIECSGRRRRSGSAGIEWVIVGCESGPKRRPMDIDWARSVRDQCVAAGVPFFLKQAEIDGTLVKMPALDGQVWDQMPEWRTGGNRRLGDAVRDA